MENKKILFVEKNPYFGVFLNVLQGEAIEKGFNVKKIVEKFRELSEFKHDYEDGLQAIISNDYEIIAVGANFPDKMNDKLKKLVIESMEKFKSGNGYGMDDATYFSIVDELNKNIPENEKDKNITYDNFVKFYNKAKEIKNVKEETKEKNIILHTGSEQVKTLMFAYEHKIPTYYKKGPDTAILKMNEHATYFNLPKIDYSVWSPQGSSQFALKLIEILKD